MSWAATISIIFDLFLKNGNTTEEGPFGSYVSYSSCKNINQTWGNGHSEARYISHNSTVSNVIFHRTDYTYDAYATKQNQCCQIPAMADFWKNDMANLWRMAVPRHHTGYDGAICRPVCWIFGFLPSITFKIMIILICTGVGVNEHRAHLVSAFYIQNVSFHLQHWFYQLNIFSVFPLPILMETGNSHP